MLVSKFKLSDVSVIKGQGYDTYVFQEPNYLVCCVCKKWFNHERSDIGTSVASGHCITYGDSVVVIPSSCRKACKALFELNPLVYLDEL